MDDAALPIEPTNARRKSMSPSSIAMAIIIITALPACTTCSELEARRLAEAKMEEIGLDGFSIVESFKLADGRWQFSAEPNPRGTDLTRWFTVDTGCSRVSVNAK